MSITRFQSAWVKSCFHSHALSVLSFFLFLFAFCASGPLASAQAPVYVQQCNAYAAISGTESTGISCTLPNSSTAGDVLLIGIGYSTNGISTVTSTRGTAALATQNSSHVALAIYDVPNLTAGSNTVTVTFTGSGNMDAGINVMEYTNVPASPLDGVSSAIQSGTTPESGSFTTTNANDLLYTMCYTNHVTWSVGTAPITWTAITTDGDSPSGTGINVLAESGTTTTSGSKYGQCTASVGTYTNPVSAVALMPGGTVVTPTFSPAAGTYGPAQSVTISDTTYGSTIYYTTNNTTPTTASSTYSSAITVSANETLQAIATAAGHTNSAVGSAAYVINGPAATPGFSPAAGAYGPAQSVTISDGTSGATIYYTTNGTTPTTSSSTYSSAITVSATETLEAIAVAPLYTTSGVGSAAYTINGAAATPGFSPVAGAYGPAQSVTISDSTSGSTIYYTTNGTMPTTASSTYSSAITVSATETLEAIAAKAGYSNSAVGSAAYTINGPVADPGFSPTPGGYGPSQSVTISDSNGGATIYYTTNNTTPTTASTVYSGAITVTATETIEALATAPNYSNSSVITGVFTINGPVATPAAFSPSPGTYSTAQSVTISDSTSGSTIYYTTDGSTPTTNSTQYTGAVTVSSTQTLSAIGAEAGYINSSVQSGAYTISGAVTATPTFTPTSGAYGTTQSVTISDTTSGSTIYYTTNGTTPTTASSVYSSAIAVSADETLEALATASGDTASSVSTSVYVITSVATPVYVQACAKYTNGSSPSSCTLSSSSTAGHALIIGIDASGATITSVTYKIGSGSNTTLTTPTVSNTGDSASNLYAYVLPNISSGTYTVTVNYSGFSKVGLSVAEYSNVPTSPVDITSNNSGTGYIGNITSPAFTTTSADDLLWGMCGGSGSLPTVETGFTALPSIDGSSVNDLVEYGEAGAAGSMSVTCKNFDGNPWSIITLALLGGSNGYAATPTFSPGAGTYSSYPSVAISSTTPDATIYYTTDGTAPTITNTVYVNPITVTATSTLKAIATAATYTQSATGSAAYTISLTQAATPGFSPSAGTYTSIQTVTITDSTTGAAIYYTTNGTTPTTGSAVYSAPITVGSTQTLNAIAIAYDYALSSVGSAAYTINLPADATPNLSPGTGTYTSIQTVTITDSSSGSTIYYTINGSTPTTNSAVYGSAITVSSSETIEAVAISSNHSLSAVGSGVYTINLPAAATPGFSPGGSSYSTAQSVTITDSTSGSTIYYAVNSTPTTNSTVYSGAITVSTTETLEAIAIATSSGYSQSAVGSAAYTILIAATPGFSPPAASYPTAQTVTLTDSTAGATIYYTTNGSTPTTASSVYSSGITVSANETLEAIATASGYSQSAVGTGIYTIGALGGTYVIQNEASGFNLDGSGPSGTWVVQDAGVGGNQQWNVTSLGTGIYQIKNVGSFLSLDDHGDGTGNGTEIDAYTASGGTGNTGQVWYLTNVSGSYYTIASQDMVTADNNSCIEPTGGSVTTGAQIVVIVGCSNTDSEQWEFIKVAAEPAFSPAAGVYATTQTVTISDSTSGASIYYTTNGTTPTTSSTLYTGPISVPASIMFNAIAVESGYLTSGVATAAYGIGPLPENGLYDIENVNSSLVMDGGGSGATKGTDVMQDAYTSSSSQQWVVSAMGSGTFSIVSSANSFALDDLSDGTTNGTNIDVFTNETGENDSGQIWTLTPAGSGNYTLESQDMLNAANNSCIEPSGGSSTSGTDIVIIVGCSYLSAEQWQFNLIAPSAANPTFSPAQGTFTSAQTITLSDSSSGATIYYTTDGSQPTTASSVYSSPFTISCCTTETVKAFAAGTSYWQSPVVTAVYVITLPTAATPVFSPVPATYSSTQTVTITDSISGATIYYTTNGSTPTTASAQYSGPITVSSTEWLEAFATASGYNPSAMQAGQYIIPSLSLSPCDGMSVGSSEAGTANLNGFVPFQSATNGLENMWDTNIVNAAVDPNNAVIQTTSGFINETVHVNFGSSENDGGIPFMIVDSADTPSVAIGVNAEAGQSDVVVAPYPNNVPIEGGPSDCPSFWPDGPSNHNNNDAHTLVLDNNTCWLYETWNTVRCDGIYNADSETIWDMTNGNYRPWNWTSADVAGLSVMAGLVRYDEAASGQINHAIRFTMQANRTDSAGQYFVEPASHGGNSTCMDCVYSAPSVLGMRIRLKPSFNISGFSAINQAILTAMQQYGMIDADNGMYMHIIGATDSRWNDGDLANLTDARIAASNFDVIDAPPGTDTMTLPWPGFDPTTVPTGSAPTISSYTANGDTGTITVSSGASVTFDFSVSGDSFDYIDMIGPVRTSSGSGTVTINPTATQTYTLYSTNQYGQAAGTAITVVVTGATVVAPTLNPAPGTYSAATDITFNTTSSPKATYYYTTDGSTPTYPTSGTTIQYPEHGVSSNIPVSATETIKAIAVVPGYSSPSSVTTGTYTIN